MVRLAPESVSGRVLEKFYGEPDPETLRLLGCRVTGPP